VYSQTAAHFLGGNGALLFCSGSGAIDDRHELVIGAERYRLLIRVSDRYDRRKGFPALNNDDGSFSCLLGVLRERPRSFLEVNSAHRGILKFDAQYLPGAALRNCREQTRHKRQQIF
jgi:hypothetical protein